MSIYSAADHAAALVFYFFNQLSRYPRQSRKEDAIRDFVVRWARGHSYHTVIDAVGNCIITVPADIERHNSPPLALQAHFDMVCEVNVGHSHDFAQDPIIPRYRGDWVRASNTTLGADNGIGIALAMALCEDPLITHPQLELIFTVDEETGLTGAAQLEKGAIHAKHLLNLDSEDDQTLINGCAGGINLNIGVPYTPIPLAEIPLDSPIAYHLQVSGFPGGHSGVDIHKPLGNPICCMTQILGMLRTAIPDQFYFGPINGGTVHNAIPRDCTVEVVFANTATRNRAEKIATAAFKQYTAECGLIDNNATCAILPTEMNFSVCSPTSGTALIELLTGLPHGVHTLTDNPAIPRTSANIAQIETKDNTVRILLSLRSSEQSELAEMTTNIIRTAKCHTNDYDCSGSYPAWHPRPESRLLTHCKSAYEKSRGTAPRVEVIHAGLETAVIADIVEGLDMLSCGPLILNPHSPQERLSISSTAHVYLMLAQLLNDW